MAHFIDTLEIEKLHTAQALLADIDTHKMSVVDCVKIANALNLINNVITIANRNEYDVDDEDYYDVKEVSDDRDSR